jgi:hypothetical protein
MTVAELAVACASALETEHGTVALVVPGAAPRGERVRLDRGHRRKCPMGEVLNWQEDRGTLARFDAADVLAYLAANGLIQLEIAGSEEGRK